MIEIDKDVPIPSRGRYGFKYPFAEMEIGDSFSVPSTPDNKKRIIWAVRNAANSYRKVSSHVKFTVRSLPNGEVRIWRVS